LITQYSTLPVVAAVGEGAVAAVAVAAVEAVEEPDT
jgi:hypothetical protein